MKKNNRYNKNIKNLVLSSFILIVGGIVILLGITLSSRDTTILKNQDIDGLSFTNASLEYTGNTSTFKVEVTNKNSSDYNLKYIEIKFKDSEGKENKLIGYIGNIIESNKSKEIVASIDKDITDSTNLEYSIIK